MSLKFDFSNFSTDHVYLDEDGHDNLPCYSWHLLATTETNECEGTFLAIVRIVFFKQLFVFKSCSIFETRHVSETVLGTHTVDTGAGLRVAEELDLVHEVEQRLHGVEVNDVRVGGGQRVQVGRERRAGVQRVLGERLADLGAP